MKFHPRQLGQLPEPVFVARARRLNPVALNELLEALQARSQIARAPASDNQRPHAAIEAR